MLKNGRNGHCADGLRAVGCSCCNSKQERRRAKHTAKRKEASAWKKDAR